MYANEILYVTKDEAYEHLAKSIVIQAIHDYRYAIQHHKDLKALKKFFLSDWCYLLSGYNGEYLIELLNEQEKYNDTIN